MTMRRRTHFVCAVFVGPSTRDSTHLALVISSFFFRESNRNCECVVARRPSNSGTVADGPKRNSKRSGIAVAETLNVARTGKGTAITSHKGRAYFVCDAVRRLLRGISKLLLCIEQSAIQNSARPTRLEARLRVPHY